MFEAPHESPSGGANRVMIGFFLPKRPFPLTHLATNLQALGQPLGSVFASSKKPRGWFPILFNHRSSLKNRSLFPTWGSDGVLERFGSLERMVGNVPQNNPISHPLCKRYITHTSKFLQKPCLRRVCFLQWFLRPGDGLFCEECAGLPVQQVWKREPGMPSEGFATSRWGV